MESNNEVAESFIEIKNDETISINNIGSKIYNFKIKNYNNENKVNEIDLEYYLEFHMNEKIKIKVYRNGEEIKLYNNKTEKIVSFKNLKQEDNYKIKILFLDDTEKEITDEIKMKVYCEQK